jgi:arylsulfatase A-like enzyme
VFTNLPSRCPGRPACRLKREVSVYSTRFFANMARNYIDTAPANKPVFIYYAPYAPHLPSFPQNKYADRFPNLKPYRPPSYNEADVSDKPPWIRRLPRLDEVQGQQILAERRAEYQTLITVDDEVGELVDALKATHRLAHSVILFASDNGVSWGEHRLLVGSKQLPYDEAIRVPLVVRYEPYTTHPSTDRRLVVNADWAPTLAAIAGAPHPAVDGRSFLPLLKGQRPQPAWPTEFLLEHMNGNPPSLAPDFCGIRSTGFMYARYTGGFEELYNLKTDPYELRNIAREPSQAGEIAHMRLLTKRECSPPPPGYNP